VENMADQAAIEMNPTQTDSEDTAIVHEVRASLQELTHDYTHQTKLESSGNKTHDGQVWDIWTGFVESEHPPCSDSMNAMEKAMAAEGVVGGEGFEGTDGGEACVDKEPEGCVAWLLWLTPMRLGKAPNTRCNPVGIFLNICAIINIIPTMLSSAQTALSRDCNGKGNTLVGCSLLTLLCYELTMILGLVEVSSKTAAEHIYSYCNKMEGDRQWRHLHTWWPKRVRCFFPVGFLLSIVLAVFGPHPTFNIMEWFICTPAFEFKWDQLSPGWMIARIFLYLPMVWWICWGWLGVQLLLYTHYENIRYLSKRVAEGKVTGKEIGKRYVDVCTKLRWFSKRWGWMLFFLLFGLLANLLNNFFNAFLGTKTQQTDRIISNMVNFVIIATLMGFFLRWLAGLNDEHDDFRMIVTVKAMTDDEVVGGKYLDLLMMARGRVYAGPLPVTMGLFGTLISIVSAIGPLMLVQTGLKADDVIYHATQVTTVEAANCTAAEAFTYMVASTTRM